MTIAEPTVGVYSVAAAKAHLSEILKQVEAGEEVTITRRGQPIATIRPLKPRSTAIDWAEITRLRKALPKSRLSAADLIRQMRDAGY
jgi:prevent-host-death family protein